MHLVAGKYNIYKSEKRSGLKMKGKMRVLMASLMAWSMLISSVCAASFPDVDKDADYAEAVEILNDMGIMQGNSDGKFNPNSNVTRAQLAAILCRSLGETQDLPTNGEQFSDVPESHWANGFITSDETTNNYDNSSKGHTMVLVEKNNAAGTFTVLEAGGGVALDSTYSYKKFADYFSNTKQYPYFFYIVDYSAAATNRVENPSGGIPSTTTPSTTKESKLPTNLVVSLSKDSFTVGESVVITPSANNATHYAISVWLGEFNTGERLYVNYNLPGGITFNPTKPGTYTIRADAKNSNGYIYTEKTFTVAEMPTATVDPCANGHNWDNGKTTIEPTVMNQGEKLYTCKTCYTKKTETIPAHDNIHVSASEGLGQEIIIDHTGKMTLRGDGEWTRWLINFRSDSFVLKDYKDFITSIDVEEGITSIHGHIGDFPNVTSVSLPNSLSYISTNVLENLTSLKTIQIPANVTLIGTDIFMGCTALNSIYVASGNPSYTSVDGVLFSRDMKSLWAFPIGRSGNYTIPDGVTYISEYAFAQASLLDSVTIPASVTVIASSRTFKGTNGGFHGTLYVSSGSYAEEFARENGLNYRVM